MTNLTDLQARLEVIRAESKQNIANKLAELTMQSEINKLTSTYYIQTQVAKTDMNKVDGYLTYIETLYVADKRKLTNTYGYGLMVNKLMTLCTAIQYSKAHEKAELLLLTGLSETTIEQFIEGFGKTAYFSKQRVAIIDAIPMNLTNVFVLLSEVSAELGLVTPVDTTKLNKTNIDYIYETQLAKATEMYENTLKYVDDSVLYSE